MTKNCQLHAAVLHPSSAIMINQYCQFMKQKMCCISDIICYHSDLSPPDNGKDRILHFRRGHRLSGISILSRMRVKMMENPQL